MIWIIYNRNGSKFVDTKKDFKEIKLLFPDDNFKVIHEFERRTKRAYKKVLKRYDL